MILLQLLTVAFAIALAWLNKWPVRLMRWYGMPLKKSEMEFHAANAAVKVLWAVAIIISSNSVKLKWSNSTTLEILLLLIIQWLVFDPALNLFTGKRWDYLGQTAWLDKLVKNGKVKAVALVVVIIALNYFMPSF